MLLNLASIIHTPGGIVPFSFSMDFSQSEFGGAYPAQEPVLVSGQVRNEAGVLLLSAEMKSVTAVPRPSFGTTLRRYRRCW